MEPASIQPTAVRIDLGAIWGQNKVCSKSCAKLERTLNITRRGGFFWQVARA